MSAARIRPAGIDARLQHRFSYSGEDAYGYGLSVNGHLAAVCWFWGHRRSRGRVPWPLSAGEAVMVDLLTLAEYRGRGLATLLIRHAGMEMRHFGNANSLHMGVAQSSRLLLGI